MQGCGSSLTHGYLGSIFGFKGYLCLLSAPLGGGALLLEATHEPRVLSENSPKNPKSFLFTGYLHALDPGSVAADTQRQDTNDWLPSCLPSGPTTMPDDIRSYCTTSIHQIHVYSGL